jgi:hypothetical protein
LSFDQCDWSDDNDAYLTAEFVAKMAPGRSYPAAYILTAAQRYLNSPPKLQQNCGQVDPNINDYYADPK